uniref:Uncharacterized protein n=1 Tax=Molossus molossus TaxID=27622 RepID=A0A7J8I8J7_MOLMO|nr:hypothetical protein HJG59_010503 [Molossus molossus]
MELGVHAQPAFAGSWSHPPPPTVPSPGPCSVAGVTAWVSSGEGPWTDGGWVGGASPGRGGAEKERQPEEEKRKWSRRKGAETGATGSGQVLLHWELCPCREFQSSRAAQPPQLSQWTSAAFLVFFSSCSSPPLGDLQARGLYRPYQRTLPHALARTSHLALALGVGFHCPTPTPLDRDPQAPYFRGRSGGGAEKGENTTHPTRTHCSFPAQRGEATQLGSHSKAQPRS